MRVTNTYRWERTKLFVLLVLLITSIGFGGGLEGEQPIPNFGLAVFFGLIGLWVATRINSTGGLD